jgi:hypothetical protein
MYSILRKSALLAGAMMMTMAAAAQQPQSSAKALPIGSVDVAVTYNAQYSLVVNSSSRFWTQGGSAELGANVYHGLGVAANVTGTTVGNVHSSGEGLTLVTTTFGPRYTWALPYRRSSSREMKVFGEALVGIANGVNSVFPSSMGVQSSANSLALQTGGGMDLGLTHHIGLRLIQASWLRTELPNGAANVQNNLLLGSGIVFRFQ